MLSDGGKYQSLATTYCLITYIPTFVLFYAVLYPLYILLLLSTTSNANNNIKIRISSVKELWLRESMNTISGVDRTKEETKANYIL